MTATDPTGGRLQQPTAAAVRARLRRLLATRTAGPPPRAVVDDILLVATELVTNALRHGGGLTAFDARLDGDTVVLSVSDASPTPPRTVPRSHPAAPGGFGWPLVRRLSRHVTVTPTGGGKTIEVVLGTAGQEG
ncbi:ATP-binding protein [Streptomyces cinereospinus]|uniref:ATP-binding protein n=1 Tax=Streptomyces cinereospinus TaxID=285561 RepID=A0ABV5N0Y9_9ACTN